MRIAITGGIAEGKSTVLGYIAEFGHSVASADAIAREVWEDSEIHQKVAQLFGVTNPSREQVRDLIVGNAELRAGLDRILHPEILRRMNLCAANFIEVPLLIETCLQGSFDKVWVVTCGAEEQRKRLAARMSNSAEGEAFVDAMLAMQLPTSAKTVFSDVVIRTNEPEARVRDVVAQSVKGEFST